MKILIVNYHYPPSATAHSYRWALLRCFFLQQGHSVDFICGGVTDEQDNGNSIYRGNFPFTVKKGHSNFVSASNKSADSLKSKLLSLVKYTYRKYFGLMGCGIGFHFLYIKYSNCAKKNMIWSLVILQHFPH